MENLLHYPPSVIVNRALPKKVFYDHLDMSTKMRQHFTDDIASLTWLYKLGAGTVNVATGKRIVEIDFFSATLKDMDVDDNVFTFIDSTMPRYIVFIQCFEDKYRLLLDYKDPSDDESHPFKIIKTFKTEWLTADKLQLPITGRTLDDVWENFAGQISGFGTSTSENTRTIITLEAQIAQKVRTAEALQKKIRKERQFNRQVEMNTKARQLKREIASLEEQIVEIKAKNNK